jgi:hypothetical protein
MRATVSQLAQESILLLKSALNGSACMHVDREKTWSVQFSGYRSNTYYIGRDVTFFWHHLRDESQI